MSRVVLLAICSAALFTYCSHTISESEYGVNRFVFEYDGSSFYIISYTHQDKVGYNLLTSGKKDVRFAARDLYQDGTIDEIIKGPYTLEEANRIYAYGIQKAKNKGNLESREIKRKYKTEDGRYRYLVTTILPIIGEPYNTFAVMEKVPFAQSVIFKDDHADGSLDSVLFGNGDLEYGQKLYDGVLKMGLADKSMEKSDSTFLVSL